MESIEARSVHGLPLDEAAHFWSGLTGIYLISTPEGLPYVGKSRNIGKRMQGHLSLIDSDDKTHHSPKMTEAKLDGATGFTVQLLEECSYAELRDRERHWMRKYPNAINDKMSNRLRGQGKPSRKLTRVRCNIPIPMELAARLHELAEGEGIVMDKYVADLLKNHVREIKK